jgi:acetylornithine deacetylase/succinyl-diaminopimelate desuccinylase-like protein
VTVWIDARCPDEAELSAWHAELQAALPDVAARTGVDVTTDVAARSAPTVFDLGLRAALSAAAAALGHAAPEVLCMAGHDAGVVQRARPAAMVLVRNREGVSHAPDEHVDLADAAVAATVLLTALDGLEAGP